METGSSKPKTFNVRKTQRFETKKRKVQALLNLFEENKGAPMKKKKCNSLVESYKALKLELKKYVKKPEVEPCLYLTHHGQKAQLDLKNPERKAVDPLFVEDVYQLLLRSVIGHLSPYPLSWAKLEQPQNITKTVLIVIKGFTKSDIISNIQKLNSISEIFPHIVEILSSNIPFATELSTLHLVTDFHVQEKETYTTLFPKEKDIKLVPPSNSYITSKLHLLLSPIQMAMENYPFPKSVCQRSKSEGYVFTKDAYSPVTEDSPLFAVDCEMCLTTAGLNELTSIAVIDENSETVYHTLVKPHNKIVNYFTKFSGITREMLVGVTVRLVDVQNHLRVLLPPNAILCGQSLNGDLHAIRMIHPYVIDTSVIFNSSGFRGRKDSLKKLMMRHLNEEIQAGKDGHDAIEDSLSAMKLVQLKLQNTIQYGDACLHTVDKPKINITNENAPLLGDTSCVSEEKREVASGRIEIKNGLSKSKPLKDEEGFFAKLLKFSKKSCLIGSKESLSHYNTDMLTEAVQVKVKTNREKSIRSTIKNMEFNDFVICHLDFDFSTLDHGLFDDLNSIIQQVHESCIDRSMFGVLVTGVDETKYADIKSGLFMTALRKVK